MAPDLMETLNALLGKRPKPLHMLKWKIPEARFTAPVEDADATILEIRKHARFLNGGEFTDTIHAKKYGEETFAYFIVRVDKRTEEERLFFDGYMLQEEETLDVDLTSAFSIETYLDKMGYKQALMRDVRVWKFQAGIVPITVYSIADFGDFVEVALPATKFAKAREAAQGFALKLLEKIGVKQDEVIPTDIITLQMLQTQEAGQLEAEAKDGASEADDAEASDEDSGGDKSSSSGSGKKVEKTKGSLF